MPKRTDLSAGNLNGSDRLTVNPSNQLTNRQSWRAPGHQNPRFAHQHTLIKLSLLVCGYCPPR
jgi:hypothetical protein